ncbi:MAG: hypothetical protein ACKOCM_12390, partial [Cyanobacteriota bacterium]
MGDVVDAGGWELVEQLFYAGEPTSEAATGRVVVSINASIPGSALYLNTTRSEDLDGDGEARFDEAGTGFREITVLSEGVASASSPQIVGGDPSRDRRYPAGLKAQLNPSFSLVQGGTRLSHTLLQAGWRSGGAGTLGFEAWAYDLQAFTDPAGTVVDLTGTTARPLALQIPSSAGSWREDSSLTPVWSNQNGNAQPDLILGNWLWLDPGSATTPVLPSELVATTPALRSRQVPSSPLQRDWSSVVLESTGWPINGKTPLWAFASADSNGEPDSFTRLDEASGTVDSSEGQWRTSALNGAITPDRYGDVLSLQVVDLAAAEATINTTGAINRLQDLQSGGFELQRSAASAEHVLMAGVSFEGRAELRLTDARGLTLTRLELPGIEAVAKVGWFREDQAWVLLQSASQELQLWSIRLSGKAGSIALKADPLAALPSSNGLLSQAAEALVQTCGDGLVLTLPIAQPLAAGDLFTRLHADASAVLNAGSQAGFAQPLGSTDGVDAQVRLADGTRALINGSSSLLLLHPDGSLKALTPELKDGETIVNNSLAISGNNLYWISSRHDGVSNRQSIWRSRGGITERLLELGANQQVQQPYASEWLKACSQGDLFLLSSNGYGAPVELQRLPAIAGQAAQSLASLNQPGNGGGSHYLADVVVATDPAGEASLLAYAADFSGGKGVLQLGRFQSDGSLVLKPVAGGLKPIGYGSLAAAVQPLADGGFLVLDGSSGTGYDANHLVHLNAEGALVGSYALGSSVSSYPGISGLSITPFGMGGVAFLDRGVSADRLMILEGGTIRPLTLKGSLLSSAGSNSLRLQALDGQLVVVESAFNWARDAAEQRLWRLELGDSSSDSLMPLGFAEPLPGNGYGSFDGSISLADDGKAGLWLLASTGTGSASPARLLHWAKGAETATELELPAAVDGRRLALVDLGDRVELQAMAGSSGSADLRVYGLELAKAGSFSAPTWLAALDASVPTDLTSRIKAGDLANLSVLLRPGSTPSAPDLRLLNLQSQKESINSPVLGWVQVPDAEGQIWQVQVQQETNPELKGLLSPVGVILTPVETGGKATGESVHIRLSAGPSLERISGVAITADGVLITGLASPGNNGSYSSAELAVQWLPINPAERHAAAGKTALQIATNRTLEIGLTGSSGVSVDGLLSGGKGEPTVFGQRGGYQEGYATSASAFNTIGYGSGHLWTLALPSVAELELWLANDQLAARGAQLSHAIVDVAGLSARDLARTDTGAVLAVGGNTGAGTGGSSWLYSSEAAEGFVSIGSDGESPWGAVVATLLEAPSGLQSRGLQLSLPDPADPTRSEVIGELYAARMTPVLAVWSTTSGIVASSPLPLRALIHLDESGKTVVREEISAAAITPARLGSLSSPQLLGGGDGVLVLSERRGIASQPLTQPRQWLLNGDQQWLVPEDYGTLLQVVRDGQAISRRADGSLELLRFDATALFGGIGAGGATAVLVPAWIRQRHALSDLGGGKAVLAAQLQQVPGTDSPSPLTRLTLVVGSADARELVQLDVSDPDRLPLASDETVVMRRIAAGDRDGNGSEESLLLQGVIQRPDPLIAGASQERPLLLLRTSGSSDAQPGSYRFDLDLNVSLEDLTTSRGTRVPRGASLSEASALWVSFDPQSGFRESAAGSNQGLGSILLAGNISDSPSPREADPLLALLQQDAKALGGWHGITPRIWSDANNDGAINDEELRPFGIYAGDLHVFDANDDGKGDLATIGFGTATRRAADGNTLAIPQTNLFLFHSTLADGTPILKATDLNLYGLANGTINSGDIDGDGDLDLLLNGEDFFALPNNENNLADSAQAGGNPVTLVYRNLLRENAKPGDQNGELAFENALFPINNNDQRWANFDYAFDASELTAILPDLIFSSSSGQLSGSGLQLGAQVSVPFNGQAALLKASNLDKVIKDPSLDSNLRKAYELLSNGNFGSSLTSRRDGFGALIGGQFPGVKALLNQPEIQSALNRLNLSGTGQLLLKHLGSGGVLSKLEFGLDPADGDAIKGDWIAQTYSFDPRTSHFILSLAPNAKGIGSGAADVVLGVFAVSEINLTSDLSTDYPRVPLSEFGDEKLYSNAIYRYIGLSSPDGNTDYSRSDAIEALQTAFRQDIQALGNELEANSLSQGAYLQPGSAGQLNYGIDLLTLSPRQGQQSLAGLYELELHATDHRRAGQESLLPYTEPDTSLHLGTVSAGTGAPMTVTTFKQQLAQGTLLAMERIFAEPQYTQTANEAALLSSDPNALNRQFPNGDWIWTPTGSAYSLESADIPALGQALIQARNINASVPLQTVIDTFTTGQRLQEISNYDLLAVLSGTAVEDVFRLGDAHQNLYGTPVSSGANGTIVVIDDFNPFLDTIELYLPEDASFVWDQILYRKDPEAPTAPSGGFSDRVLATDEGGNERAAERFLSQPILDSYGRKVLYSYALQEYRPTDYSDATVKLGLHGAVLRINAIVDGVRAPETLVFFDGIDQDLLHFQTSFNEGRIRFASADDQARRQLRFIISNNGSDGDDVLDQDDAYRIPFRRSLLGDWLEDAFTGLPEFFGVLTGGDGNDVLRGSTADAAVPVMYLDGGLGNDVIYGSDVDQYNDILLGQEGDDVILGLRGPNRMDGGSGNDTIRGGFNNDVLIGGSGHDLLIGGEGFDRVSHRDDPGAAQVNLSWREQPVILLPGSGDARQLAPDTLLKDLPAELLALLTPMASRGYRRFDPLSSLAALLGELSDGDTALLPELGDITASNPILWIPGDPDADLVRLDRNGLLRDVEAGVRGQIETALLRKGITPRSTLSVVEAAQLAASSQLLDLGRIKLIGTAVSAYSSRDGWGDTDRLATALQDLPGSSIAEAALARDAARLLAVPSNTLRDLALELQQEWQTRRQAEANGLVPLPGTPLADARRLQLQSSFTAATSNELIEAGRSGDLDVWLNAFARAIATEQPTNLSSRAVAEALTGVLSQIENIEGSGFNDVLVGDYYFGKDFE